MLNKSSAVVLNTLRSLLSGSAYEVFKVAEIFSALPVTAELSEEELKNEIAFLNDGEYISVKYQDDDEICLAVMPKGRQRFDGEEQENAKTDRRHDLFVYSFFGGFFGGLIAVTVAVVLLLTGAV
ncbi:MAG: hypothetical protein MJ072_02175 [Clostridia bacterium]|nr:hypothetical protein [Clostridia bacterium]